MSDRVDRPREMKTNAITLHVTEKCSHQWLIADDNRNPNWYYVSEKYRQWNEVSELERKLAISWIFLRFRTYTIYNYDDKWRKNNRDALDLRVTAQKFHSTHTLTFSETESSDRWANRPCKSSCLSQSHRDAFWPSASQCDWRRNRDATSAQCEKFDSVIWTQILKWSYETIKKNLLNYTDQHPCLCICGAFWF